MSRIGLAVISLVLLAAPSSAKEPEGGSLEQVFVESASTPEQHQALAKYYRGKAEHERREAANHKAMGSAYGGTKMTIAQAEKAHCEKLAALHESAAKEFDEMAAEHESLGKK